MSVDFGYRVAVVRAARGSARLPLRLVATSVALFAAAVLMATWAIRYGDYPLTAAEVFGTLAGRGDDFTAMIVLEWRLPVAISAVLFGAMLGVGGAIFQSLTRNPLGSPDLIGFDAGSYTAVVLLILLLGNANYWAVAGASLLGGMATALVVYLLARRRGVQGFRLIIVGIAMSALLGSVDDYLISRAELRDAMMVGFWGAGSIARVTWASLAPAGAFALVIAVGCILLAPALRSMELGDDAAVTQGTTVGPARILLIVVGVATTAIVTAAAGPIAFIALAAPQMAKRLARTPGVSLLASAAMGAAVLAAAHLLSLLIGQVSYTVPVGLITVCVGGCYLIWLLIHETRRRGGAS
ncbi:MAG: iron chelate uptake ABC transporter family permease subunit [Tessaracoccus sp.]|uniref:FecCD family ABC transporter permease n=1 Tax=Tessaracoccus sp. TaxID=1971211 RepID=UPI001EC0C166|nr:iron chelate uptake ABC transporter family permease subunit [Tessaracoccus sp.]MBK7820297.1 iron chelate uptake ABC transporter family permease subunit [Tessaracoccus sp.]